MIEILQELDAASNLLRSALDRYLNACSALKTCSTQKHTTSRFPREFSHRIQSELPLVNSYEARLKEAKATINQSRNSCVDTVPISSLTDDILSRIFHLVLAAPIRLAGSSRPIESSSHVCSRWRHILTSLTTLWCHIDIDIVKWSERYLARAVAYAARAGHTPLYVKISSVDIIDDAQAATFTSFLASIAPRIKSLELNLHRFTKPYPSIIGACFANCTPGVLTRLILCGSYTPSPPFLEAAEDPQMAGRLLIKAPKQFLDGLWLPITFLRLNGLYLPWASVAYQGLVSLCLLPDSGSRTRVPEQQLIEILKSSPQLRIFRFGLEIIDSRLDDDPIVPVHLECLEVLVWEPTYPDPRQLRTFLQMIAPGLYPLQVSIEEFDLESMLSDDTKRFFARSNVTKLRMRCGDGCIPIDILLDSLPPLELLSLDLQGAYIPRSSPVHRTDKLSPHSACHSSFHTLRLACCIYLDELKRIIKRHPVQVLVLELQFDDVPEFTVEEINELRTMCPSVELFDSDNPCPFGDWIEPSININLI